MDVAQENADEAWHLHSNRGNHTVSFVPLAQDEATGVWLHRVVLTVENWARPGIGSEKRVEAEVQLPQVAFTEKGLRALLGHVESWLSNQEGFRVNIAGEDQVFEIEVALREDLIVSRDKPSCTVRYKWGAAASSESAFIVDESCMRILKEQLTHALAASVSSGETH